VVELSSGSSLPSASLWVLTLEELKTNSRVRAFMDHAWERLGER
jgi:hypothetical protein